MSEADRMRNAEQYPSSDAADYGAEEIKQHFVELVETLAAEEATALAAKLRGAGIIALANAEDLRREPIGLEAGWCSYRTFVMVFKSDFDRATKLIHEELGTEGDVPSADIEEEMRAAHEQSEAVMAWFQGEDEKLTAKVMTWLMRGLVVLVVAVIAFALLS